MSKNFSINITLTWSKIMALVILICALIIDLHTGQTLAFPVAIPCVAGLLVNKQWTDRRHSEYDMYATKKDE